MRFMRLCAAIAALSCSALAGEAQAALIFTASGVLTPDSSGNSYAAFVLSPSAVNAAMKLHTKATLSAPSSGFFSFYAEGNYYVTDFHGNLIDANNMDFGGGGSFVSTRSPSFVAELPRLYGLPTSYAFFHHVPTIYFGLTGQNKPVDFSLTVNSSGVPEPATWALMILGFGGIGAALRRVSGGRRARRELLAV